MQRVKNLLQPQKMNEDEDSGLMKHHVKYYTRMKSELSESSLAECDAYMNGQTQHQSSSEVPPNPTSL